MSPRTLSTTTDSVESECEVAYAQYYNSQPSVDVTQVSREAHRANVFKMFQTIVLAEDLAYRSDNVVQGVHSFTCHGEQGSLHEAQLTGAEGKGCQCVVLKRNDAALNAMSDSGAHMADWNSCQSQLESKAELVAVRVKATAVVGLHLSSFTLLQVGAGKVGCCMTC